MAAALYAIDGVFIQYLVFDQHFCQGIAKAGIKGIKGGALPFQLAQLGSKGGAWIGCFLFGL